MKEDSLSSRVVLTYWSGGTLTSMHLQKDPGGIPIAIAEIGYHSLLVVEDSRVEAIPQVRVHDARTRGSRGVGGEIRQVLSLLDQSQVSDVIVIKGWKRQMLVTLLDRVRGAPARSRQNERTRWTLKMDWGGPYSNWITRWFTGPYLLVASLLFDRIIVETSCAQEIAERWVLGRAELCMVPDGYSPQYHSPVTYDAHPRAPVILSVARFARVKQLELLIRGFAAVSSRHPEWTLRLVGPTEDPKYRQELEQMVSSLGLRDRVLFVGEVEDVEAEFQTASIFCSTSRLESFGISRVEAVINGIPVVTSPAGCPRDLVAMGMVVLEGDLETSLESTLDRFIKDPSLRKRTADAAQGRILTWNQVTRAILAPYPEGPHPGASGRLK